MKQKKLGVTCKKNGANSLLTTLAGKITKHSAMMLAAVCVLSISACGGGSDAPDTTQVTPDSGQVTDGTDIPTETPVVENPVVIEPETMEFKVQLDGAVASSNVVVSTQDGEEIASGTTDENGVLTLIESEVGEKLIEYSVTADTKLQITATGGVDLETSESVNGTLTAIASINEIKGHYVNAITTLLDQVTNNESKLYNEALIEFLRRTNFIDINEDGTIDYLDALAYDSETTESDLETSLRIKIIDAIKSGIVDDLDAAVKQYLQAINLVFIDVNADNTDHEATLSKNNPNSTIEYTTDGGTTWTSYIEGDTLTVFGGVTLAYRENFGEYTGAVKEYTNVIPVNAPLYLTNIVCNESVVVTEGDSQTCYIYASDDDGIKSVTATFDGEAVDVTEEDGKYSLTIDDMPVGDYTIAFTVTSNTLDGGEESLTRSATIRGLTFIPILTSVESCDISATSITCDFEEDRGYTDKEVRIFEPNPLYKEDEDGNGNGFSEYREAGSIIASGGILSGLTPDTPHQYAVYGIKNGGLISLGRVNFTTLAE